MRHKADLRIHRLSSIIVKSVGLVDRPAIMEGFTRTKRSALGDFIRMRKEELEITTEDLAQAMGISPDTVNAIETGDIARPPDQRLRGAARILKVSFDRLFSLIPDELKRVIPFREWPLAPRDQAWDGDAAVGRIRVWAGAASATDTTGLDFDMYAEGFAWFDDDAREDLGSYKLPHHDVIGGQLMTVFRGTSAARAALSGARGGVDIPEGDRAAVGRHLDAHLEEFGDEEGTARAPGKNTHTEDSMDEQTKKELTELVKALLEPITAQLTKFDERMAAIETGVQETGEKAAKKAAEKAVTEAVEKAKVEQTKAEEAFTALKKSYEATKTRLEEVIEDAGKRFDKVEARVSDLARNKSQKIPGNGHEGSKGAKWPTFAKAFSRSA